MSTLNIDPIGHHEFSIGTVLSQTFSTFIGSFPSFAIAGLVIYAPFFVYYFFFAAAPEPSMLDDEDFTALFMDAAGGNSVEKIATFFMDVLLDAVVTLGAIQYCRGMPIPLSASAKIGIERIGVILGASILVNIAFILGLVLLIVPGIIAALALMAAIPVIVAEDTTAFTALDRSNNLTKGHRMAILGGGCVILLVVIIVFVGLGLLPDFLYDMIATFLLPLVTVITSCFSAATYVNLVAAKEGADSASIAAVFE